MAKSGSGTGRSGLKRRIILLALTVAALLAAAYFIAEWAERSMAKPEQRGDANLRHELERVPEIEVDGHRYRQRRDLTTILLIGVDRSTADEDETSYRNGGQADFLRLLVVDKNAQAVRQIAIDRDTMTPITILGVLGNRTGTRTERISLSHGFGRGREDSCRLTVEAVSNLLYKVPVNYYVAMDLDGIPALNDLLGGVEVTLEDDFSLQDPAMKKGATLTLQGKQAEYFVRWRMSVGDGTNAARMERQQVYLNAAQERFAELLRADQNAAGRIYDALAEHLVTDLSRGRLINEAYAAKDYAVEPPETPAGEHSVDREGFMQFVVDEADLQRLVLSVFYEKIA